jgi:hypothetical protein
VCTPATRFGGTSHKLACLKTAAASVSEVFQDELSLEGFETRSMGNVSGDLASCRVTLLAVNENSTSAYYSLSAESLILRIRGQKLSRAALNCFVSLCLSNHPRPLVCVPTAKERTHPLACPNPIFLLQPGLLSKRKESLSY